MTATRSYRYQLEHRLSGSDETMLFIATAHSPNRTTRRVLISCYPAPERSPDSPPAQLLREHLTTSALYHSAILATLDAGRDDAVYFLVHDYSPGPDLEELLTRLRARGLAMPIDAVLHLGRQIAAALSYAHTLSWRPKGAIGYHGAIAADKVHISLAGSIKLRGFGAAPAALAYRCPEQLRAPAGSTLGDLFSFGTLLYEALSGERPFDGSTDHELGASIACCRPPALHSLRPDTPADLATLIGRCLHVEPQQRYHQAAELLADIQSLLHHRQVDDGARLLRNCINGAFPERFGSTSAVLPPGQLPPWEPLSHRLSARLVELPRSMAPIRSTQVRLIRSQGDEARPRDAADRLGAAAQPAVTTGMHNG